MRARYFYFIIAFFPLLFSGAFPLFSRCAKSSTHHTTAIHTTYMDPSEWLSMGRVVVMYSTQVWSRGCRRWSAAVDGQPYDGLSGGGLIFCASCCRCRRSSRASRICASLAWPSRIAPRQHTFTCTEVNERHTHGDFGRGAERAVDLRTQSAGARDQRVSVEHTHGIVAPPALPDGAREPEAPDLRGATSAFFLLFEQRRLDARSSQLTPMPTRPVTVARCARSPRFIRGRGGIVCFPDKTSVRVELLRSEGTCLTFFFLFFPRRGSLQLHRHRSEAG